MPDNKNKKQRDSRQNIDKIVQQRINVAQRAALCFIRPPGLSVLLHCSVPFRCAVRRCFLNRMKQFY